MRKELTSIDPLRAGIISAVLYAAISLIAMPFLLIAALFSRSGGPGAVIGVLVLILLMPVMYGVFGFIAGVLSAVIYNLVVKLTGGLIFEVRDVAAVG